MRSVADLISVVPRLMVKALDRLLRRVLCIHEFSWEPGCVLRYSIARAKTSVGLPSGEAVRLGDPIIELHFWNDRLEMKGQAKSSPQSVRSAFRRSLALLAEQLRTNKRFANITAVHATLPRFRSQSCRVRHPFGFSPVIEPRSARWRVHDFFENFLVHSLRWTFRQHRARQQAPRLNRLELWFPVSELTARFGERVHPNIGWATELDGSRATEQDSADDRETVKASADQTEIRARPTIA
jgi:hypothetical protein